MKTFDLPSNSNYGDQPIPIAFPDNWDVHISKIHGYDTPALTEAQIAEKIHAAIGAKPISEGAAGKKSAVIIIDDITRPTPCEPIAKAVIAELRAAGVTMNILLLGPQSANIAVDLATLGVTQAVGSIEYARELNRFLAGTGLRLDAHMKLETGMGRTGFDVHDDSHLDEMIEALSLPHLNFTGVFTHFAVSDENGDPYTQLQFSRFTHAIERMEQATGHHFAIRHCANSGAVINYPEMHLDMVRPGLLLYGVFPAKETAGLDLRPAMSLYSRVSDVTHHHKGDTISYGRTFTCPRDMRLAVLPVGYADGLLRSLSGKGDVLLHGQRAPQVGRICMDMCMVDVTDIPEVQPGDVATIFGRDLSVAEQADKAGTIPYELLCAMSQRVQRVYID